MRLDTRIYKLEARAQELTEPSDPDAELFRRLNVKYWEAIRIIFETMSPEHADMVAVDLLEMEESTLEPWVAFERVPRLAKEVWGLAIGYSHNNVALSALAMPPAVAQIYIDHPDEHFYHNWECAKCGLRMPCQWARVGPNNTIIPSVEFFSSCPMCGGAVGYNLFTNHR